MSVNMWYPESEANTTSFWTSHYVLILTYASRPANNSLRTAINDIINPVHSWNWIHFRRKSEKWLTKLSNGRTQNIRKVRLVWHKVIFRRENDEAQIHYKIISQRDQLTNHSSAISAEIGVYTLFQSKPVCGLRLCHVKIPVLVS